jgi:hypothetical protein
MEEIRDWRVVALAAPDETAGFLRLVARVADRRARRRGCKVHEQHPDPDFFLEM